MANLETLISVTGDLSYDETLNAQTQTGFPTVGDDADDDNVANLGALTATYTSRLFNSVANGGLGLSTAAVDGQATTQVLTINNGAGLTDLGFAASDGSALSGQTSGLSTTSGKEIFLFSDTDNNIVLGKYDSDGDLVPDAVAFVVVLEEIKNNSGVVTGGKVWTIAFESLNHTENPLDPTDHDNVIDLTDKLFVKASQEVVFGNFDDAPANQNAWTPIDNNPNSTSDIQLLVTGLNLVAQDAANESYGDSVNTRATSLGSGSQSVTNGKGLRFDFVTGIQTPIDNTAADFTQSIAYGNHSEISGAGVSIVQSTPTNTRLDLEVSIFDVQANTAIGNDFVDGLEVYDAANNVEVDIQSVQIIRELNNGTLQTIEWRDKDGNLVGNSPDNASLTLTITGNTVLVDGLLTSGWGNSPTSTKGYQILVRAANGDVFDRMVVKNVGDDAGDGSFDLGGFRILDANTDIDEVGSKINFDDDGPSVSAVTDTTASVTHDETPGLQNATATPTPAGDANDNDIAGSALAFASGATTVAQVFAGAAALAGTGDPHVAAKDNGAIGFARSANALVTNVSGSFGADGAGAVGLSYGLTTTNGTYSGVETTGGTRIFLYNGTVADGTAGLILGRVGTEGGANPDTANPTGQVAFALAADSGNGKVLTAQYLSLKHPTPGSSFDEGVTLATGAVFMTVTRTDSEGDIAVDSNNDISLRVFFEDDGPSNFSPAAIAASDNVQNQPSESATKDLTNSASTTVAANHSGSDGLGSLLFSGTDGSLLQGAIGGGSTQNLTSGGDPIYLFGFGSELLVATTDSTNSDTAQRVFTISIDRDANQQLTDTYSFNMLGQIDNNAESLFLNFAGQKQTIYEWLTLDFPGNDPGDVDDNDPGTTIDPDERDGDVLFTGIAHDGNNGIVIGPGVDTQINVSSTGIGVSDQSMDGDSYKVNGQNTTLFNGVLIDFVDGATRTLDGQLAIDQLDFDTHYSVNNSGFAISQLKPNKNTVTDVRVSVYDETATEPADSAAELANNQAKTITEITVQVRNAANVVTDQHIFIDDDVVTIGGRSVSVDFQGGDKYVEIDGMGERYDVLIKTADGFEQIRVDNVGSGNEGFDISGIFIEQFDAGDPITMAFNVGLQDGDFDVASGIIGVTLTPPDLIL